MRHESWQTEFPEEEGDYLWIEQWSCGCCLIKQGIAYATEVIKPEIEKLEYGDGSMYYFYTTPSGKAMKLWWGHITVPTFYDGADKKPNIHWWKKIELPPYLDEFDNE